MKYTPVLIEVVPEKLKKDYGGSTYLLQVWRDKKKVFEKGLESKSFCLHLCV